MYQNTIYSLTDTDFVNAQPSGSNRKIYDHNGLYLLIKTTGAKLWRFKYSYEGIEQSVTFVFFPEPSLNAARVMCDQHHEDILQGIGPSQKCKAFKKSTP